MHVRHCNILKMDWDTKNIPLKLAKIICCSTYVFFILFFSSFSCFHTRLSTFSYSFPKNSFTLFLLIIIFFLTSFLFINLLFLFFFFDPLYFLASFIIPFFLTFEFFFSVFLLIPFFLAYFFLLHFTLPHIQFSSFRFFFLRFLALVYLVSLTHQSYSECGKNRNQTNNHHIPRDLQTHSTCHHQPKPNFFTPPLQLIPTSWWASRFVRFLSAPTESKKVRKYIHLSMSSHIHRASFITLISMHTIKNAWDKRIFKRFSIDMMFKFKYPVQENAKLCYF